MAKSSFIACFAEEEVDKHFDLQELQLQQATAQHLLGNEIAKNLNIPKLEGKEVEEHIKIPKLDSIASRSSINTAPRTSAYTLMTSTLLSIFMSILIVSSFLSSNFPYSFIIDNFMKKSFGEKELAEHHNFHKWLRELENTCKYNGKISTLQLRACHKVRHQLNLQKRNRKETNLDNELATSLANENLANLIFKKKLAALLRHRHFASAASFQLNGYKAWKEFREASLEISFYNKRRDKELPQQPRREQLDHKAFWSASFKAPYLSTFDGNSFQEETFKEETFTEESFADSSLEEETFTEESFADSSLEEETFSESSLEDSSLTESSSADSSFEDSSFEDTSFKDSSFDKSSFEKSSFDKRTFYKTSLEESSFQHSSLTESSFEQSSFEERSFDQSSLEERSLEQSSLEESSLEPNSFEDSSLAKSSLEPSSFEDSSFEDSSFRASSFQGDSLDKASFQSTTLSTELPQLQRRTSTPELPELERTALHTELPELERRALEKAASGLELSPTTAQLEGKLGLFLGGGSFHTSPRRGGVLSSRACLPQLHLTELDHTALCGSSLACVSFLKGSFVSSELGNFGEKMLKTGEMLIMLISFF